MGCDLYNGDFTGDTACTVTANACASANYAGPTLLVLNDQGGGVMNVSDKPSTLRAQMKHHEPIIVYPVNTMVATRGGRDDMRTCFGIGEAGDPQFTLSAAHEHAVCYAIEGNTVDLNRRKNGCGWCEDVSPTLNTQDRHAICFQLCGDRDNPSVSFSETAYCIPANPMSDRGQAICIALEGNGARPSHMGGGFSEDGKSYTLNTIERHAVCYAVDCRNNEINQEISGTLQAHNLGGWSVNCTNPVIYERREDD